MVTREDIFKYVKDNYNTEPDYPWSDTPNCGVLRHKVNRKWYGLIMDVSFGTVGLEGDGIIDVINLKLDPEMILQLSSQKGFRPAYHMNKIHWITIILDGSVMDDEIYNLIDLSYDLTK
ncbi:MAG: MmcQ/YjbR family DNA-binding protein [Lachnospiraceae bacterium]|nr:MmcQ/YjbR family DNA-binding protein [Lachnospiraceae bacterium]